MCFRRLSRIAPPPTSKFRIDLVPEREHAIANLQTVLGAFRMPELSGHPARVARQGYSKTKKTMKFILVCVGIVKEGRLYAKMTMRAYYHPGKANVVADALSRKERLKPRHVRAMAMTVQIGMRENIQVAQSEALKKENILMENLHGLDQQMEKKKGESLYIMDRIWVPLIGDVRTIIMDEAHKSKYYWHPTSGANKDVKAEHQRPSGLLQQPEIPEWNTEKLAKIYVDEIVTRHGVPVSIISDRDGRFTSRCWQTVQKALGTRLDMSTAYHPQMDGQSDEVYRLILMGLRIGESNLIGPELVQETTDKVVLIKEKLKAARRSSKELCYNNNTNRIRSRRSCAIEITHLKGVIRFGKKGKLAPRYVGPFEILERIGLVAYQLRLPEELSGVHDTFHMSNLKKCLADASLHVPLDEIKVDRTLHFVEEPVEIMDREVKSLKRSKIALVKVRWNSKHGPEFTWECEDYMKSKYP
ncbi:putative reverse transcriptase domain-containing protein [Tanacetum coccineum]